MDDIKTISVIVPVYNRAQVLERCIQSILQQTYKKIELILVDDGSTDDSAAICDKYRTQDDRIVVIHQENQGVSAARNAGIRASHGQYVQFADSDDYLEKFMCEKILQKAEETSADLVICGYWLEESGNKKAIYATDTDFSCIQDFSEEFAYYIKTFIFYSPCNKLYRRELIANYFNTDYFLGEDLMFNLDYLSGCNHIAGIREPLYHYLRVGKKSYQKKGIEIACSLHQNLYAFVVSQSINSRENIRMIDSILIDDVLYNIKMAFREGCRTKQICDVCMQEEFQQTVIRAKTDSIKSRLVYWMNRFHAWYLLKIWTSIQDWSNKKSVDCMNGDER